MNHIRHVFLMLALTASMLFWTGIAVTPATAASIPYHFTFTGEVDHVSSPLRDTNGGVFNTSQSMYGSMTVDPGMASPTHPGIGTYTIQTFSLNIGGYTATMGTSGQVEIRDRLNGLDRFTATVNAPVGDPEPVNFLTPRLFDIQLRGPASLFDNNALPTTVPSISDFNFNRWRLIFGPGNGKVVRGELTSLTVVPLPAAVILFGAGLVALVGLGAGSWRQKKNSLT